MHGFENGFPYKMHFFREMQFASHCYTVVSYQAPSRLSVYKNSAVYLSGARVTFFFTIHVLGSPTSYRRKTSKSIRATFTKSVHKYLRKSYSNSKRYILRGLSKSCNNDKKHNRIYNTFIFKINIILQI